MSLHTITKQDMDESSPENLDTTSWMILLQRPKDPESTPLVKSRKQDKIFSWGFIVAEG